MTSLQSSRSRALAVFQAAFLLFFTLGVAIPETAFRSDPDDMLVSLPRVLGYGLLLALALAACLCGVGRLLGARAARIVAALLVASAYLFYLQANLFLPDYGFFDGSDIDYERFDFRGGVEVGVWVLGLLVALYASSWVARHLPGIVGFLLVVQVGSALVAAVTQEGMWDPFERWDRDAAFFDFSNESNVILVMLDGFKGPVFDRAMAELDDPPAFDGFTNFSDTLAAFIFTHMSLPALLSGSTYRNNEPSNDFLAVQLGERSLPETLARQGFTSHVSTDPSYCPSFERTRCMAINPYNERLEILSFLDLVLFRTLPHYAKKPLRLERGWFQRLGREEDWLLPEQRNSIELIEEFERRARVVSGPPTFKFLHLLLPHAPWLLGADCELLPAEKIQTPRAYLGQAACALGLMGGLLSTLERIGVYDSSLVVLFSDHGTAVQFPGEPAFSYQIGRARSLLLLKPPDSRGALQSLANPVSVSDLPSTVASILDLKESYPGESVFEKRSDRSPRRYHVYSGDEVGSYLSPIQEFLVRGPAGEPLSWKEGRLFEPPSDD